MRIGIHGRDFKTRSTSFIESLLDRLNDYKAEIWLSNKFVTQIGKPALKRFKYKTFELNDDLKKLNFFFSLGGDGTMLESVTYVGKAEVPIIGINTGRLGFLATTSREQAEKTLEHLFKENYVIEERTLLRLISKPKLFGNQNFALNDFTIMKKDTSSMITVHVYVDGDLLNSYWADGVILSTPTGSTGYSLSCGGPLVSPKSASFIVTPVSPHNLGSRPIVIHDSAEITFQIEGRSKNYLISLDSRFETVDESVRLTVKKEKFAVKLVIFPGQNYFDTLRQKLNWGMDVRN